jgi:hypothetical protein
MTGEPMTEVFDISDLKPECLHAVIKTDALLFDMGEIMAVTLPEEQAFDLAVKLEQEHGWYKSQSVLHPRSQSLKRHTPDFAVSPQLLQACGYHIESTWHCSPCNRKTLT